MGWSTSRIGNKCSSYLSGLLKLIHTLLELEDFIFQKKKVREITTGGLVLSSVRLISPHTVSESPPCRHGVDPISSVSHSNKKKKRK